MVLGVTNGEKMSYKIYQNFPPWATKHISKFNDGKEFIEEGDLFALDSDEISFRIYEGSRIRLTDYETGLLRSIQIKKYSHFLNDGWAVFSKSENDKPTIIHLSDDFDFNLEVDVADVALITA
jgi:hypothetical protein